MPTLLDNSMWGAVGIAHEPTAFLADLIGNVTRSNLGLVALNIADLAEHAIDAVPDRVALICGENQITYAELEEGESPCALSPREGREEGRQGRVVLPQPHRDRHRDARHREGGAILVNVNFRYVEGELRYLFENSDMVALVHERQYADRVANVLPDTPKVTTVLVVEDGSDGDYQRYGGSSSSARSLTAPPSEISGSAARTTSTCCTPAGRRDFEGRRGATKTFTECCSAAPTSPPASSSGRVRPRQSCRGESADDCYPIPPMIHGATQSATWMALFSGQTVVLAPEFDAAEVWRTISRHKVNLLFFTGDAMGRPLLDALQAARDGERATGLKTTGEEHDLSSLFLLASTAALFSASIRRSCLNFCPTA